MGLGIRERRRRIRLIILNPYCTTSVSPTLRVRPALLPETVTLYVPFGVAPPPAEEPFVVPGINRGAEHPPSPIALLTSSSASMAPGRALRISINPAGSSTASQTLCCRSPGRSGMRRSADAVAIVTVTSVAPAIAGPLGVTVHVAYAGAPAHAMSAVPGSPAAPRSSSA